MKDKSIYVRVTVYAGRKRESIQRILDYRFEIETKAPAVRNLANQAVRAMIATHYAVPVSNVHIVSGHHHPKKIYAVTLKD